MSMNFGELIPVTTLETVPGDHIQMHASDLIRAIPMVTSPFLRAKQHLDVWYVPYHDLWHGFENFITKKTQPVSSALQEHDYCPWINRYDLFKAVDDGGVNNDKDIVGRNVMLGSKRLLNYLGYGKYEFLSQSLSVYINPFRLAAYNYIWYNEYRQAYYDNGMNLATSMPNAAYLFNFDDLTCSTQANAQISSAARLEAMAQMRYRTWKKDLFTGLLPSTQFGNVSTFDSVSTVFGDNSSANGLGFSNIYQANSGGIYGVSTGGNSVFSVDSSFDVLSLRRSEAIQIWRESALRAGNRVKDNMRAHYGVESDVKDHRPIFLGSVSAPLNIGDVMATANSDYTGNTNPNTNVGDIAGKGLSSLDEKVFKFDAKDFGVIMVMASILPEAEYNAEGISRPNQLLEAEDFFTPEYENLGLEAVSSQTFKHTTTNIQKVVGYAPRYFGYKTKLDKCYDDFMTNGSLASWCSPKYDVTQALSTPQTTLPLSCLYVNPNVFNVNFSVSLINSPQFLCDFYFDVDAVRPMSVIGLPFS